MEKRWRAAIDSKWIRRRLRCEAPPLGIRESREKLKSADGRRLSRLEREKDLLKKTDRQEFLSY
jgi:hypothetical protein